MSYDDNGQLVKSEKSTAGGNGEEGGGDVPVEVTAYQWNDQGMLVKVILPNGEPVEYQYDGTQRLTDRKDSEGEDLFVQSGWDIMTKMDDVGKRTYYTGMSAISGAGSSSGSSSASPSGSSAVESEDSVKYFHYNHRGDTVLVTDAEGNTLNNFSYEAYGKPTNNEGIPINTLSLANATDPGDSTYSTTGTGNTSGGSGNNLPNLFVGASGIRYDTKTNLHYMRYRWFSGEQMRFISADLLMDLNRYAYVEGNPISLIDPSGLDAYIGYYRKGDDNFKIIKIDTKPKWNGHPPYAVKSAQNSGGSEIFWHYEIAIEQPWKKGMFDLTEFFNNNRYSDEQLLKYRRVKSDDDNIQNCFMLASLAEIPGRMSHEDFKQFVEDNFRLKASLPSGPSQEALRKVKTILKPGDVIAYRDKSFNVNFQHATTVIGKNNGNVYVVERDADRRIYGGTLDNSIGSWGQYDIEIFELRPDSRIYFYTDEDKTLKKRTPFGSLRHYCGIDSSERIKELINWISTRR